MEKICKNTSLNQSPAFSKIILISNLKGDKNISDYVPLLKKVGHLDAQLL
jgi:hypothetical protein